MSNIVKAVKAPTAAQLAAEREAINARLAEIANIEQEVKNQEKEKVKAYLDTLPAAVKKATGIDANLAMIAGWAKSHAAGTFGLGVVNSGTNADKGKRLTDEQKAALKADLLARDVALRSGQPAQQVSAIRTKHGISDSAIKAYRPTADEVTAEVARLAAAIAAPAAV